jgi:tripartite-type tricarboxylate transporter receptor subunit TctC
MISRRALLRRTGVLGMTAASWDAHPQSDRTRLIVGFPAGGPVDIAARFIAPLLAQRLGQEVVVENLVGESGNVATATVAKAAPDGQTLLLSAVVNTINTSMFRGLPFDFERDLVPVAGLYRVPLIVEVHPASPATTAAEFVALARRNPGALKVGYAGKGTPQHLAIEVFKAMAGVDVTLVPYAGSAPALQDLLLGRIDAMFDPAPSSIGLVQSGQLRALAVTGSEPLAGLAGVPPLSKELPGYVASSWFGISAPRGMPRDRVDALNAATNAALAAPSSVATMMRLGATPMSGTPEDFAAFIRDETHKHANTVAASRLAASAATR